jgi:hypothetical protein
MVDASWARVLITTRPKNILRKLKKSLDILIYGYIIMIMSNTSNQTGGTKMTTRIETIPQGYKWHGHTGQVIAEDEATVTIEIARYRRGATVDIYVRVAKADIPPTGRQ